MLTFKEKRPMTLKPYAKPAKAIDVQPTRIEALAVEAVAVHAQIDDRFDALEAKQVSELRRWRFAVHDQAAERLAALEEMQQAGLAMLERDESGAVEH